jgi:hypothetical protein
MMKPAPSDRPRVERPEASPQLPLPERPSPSDHTLSVPASSPGARAMLRRLLEPLAKRKSPKKRKVTR